MSTKIGGLELPLYVFPMNSHNYCAANALGFKHCAVNAKSFQIWTVGQRLEQIKASAMTGAVKTSLLPPLKFSIVS